MIAGLHRFLVPLLPKTQFPELQQRAKLSPPPISVLPSADASLQSRDKPAPSAKLNFMPLQFPRVIFPPLGA